MGGHQPVGLQHTSSELDRGGRLPQPPRPHHHLTVGKTWNSCFCIKQVNLGNEICIMDKKKQYYAPGYFEIFKKCLINTFLLSCTVILNTSLSLCLLTRFSVAPSSPSVFIFLDCHRWLVSACTCTCSCYSSWFGTAEQEPEKDWWVCNWSEPVVRPKHAGIFQFPCVYVTASFHKGVNADPLFFHLPGKWKRHEKRDFLCM